MGFRRIAFISVASKSRYLLRTRTATLKRFYCSDVADQSPLPATEQCQKCSAGAVVESAGGDVDERPDKSFCTMFENYIPDPAEESKQIRIEDVPGLSANCFNCMRCKSDEQLGPGVATDAAYKNVEYYSYHQRSFHEAELELNVFRGPQPDAKRKP